MSPTYAPTPLCRYKMEGLENVREETVSTPFGAPSDKCVCISTRLTHEVTIVPRFPRSYIIGTLGDVEIVRACDCCGTSGALPRASKTVSCVQVFLPRHGRGHVFNPSEVNYRANVFGMKKLGVSWIISVTAVGRCAFGGAAQGSEIPRRIVWSPHSANCLDAPARKEALCTA